MCCESAVAGGFSDPDETCRLHEGAEEYRVLDMFGGSKAS
jgi:hypothetical protein